MKNYEIIGCCCFGSVPYEEPWAFGDGFNGSGHLFAPCMHLMKGEEKHMAGITEAGYIKDKGHPGILWQAGKADLRAGRPNPSPDFGENRYGT